MAESRYVVGIDLGTTTSVLAFVDTGAGEVDPDAPPIQTMAVPQLVRAGEVATRDRLPSFLYLPAAGELPAASLELPWGRSECPVGELARVRGAEVP
jgi:molecular chaperone DnaK (HSP70)